MAMGSNVEPQIESGSAPFSRPANQSPAYLKSLVQAIAQDWEIPDPDQFEHAYQSYLETLLVPIEQLEESLVDNQVQLRSLVQQMIEIAPDFFEKALRRTPYETGYFIGEETSDVR